MACLKMKACLKMVTVDVELTRWENDVCRHALDRHFAELELTRLVDGRETVDTDEFAAAGVLKMVFGDHDSKGFDKTWDLGEKFSDEKVIYHELNGIYIGVLNSAVGEAVEEMTKFSNHAGLRALEDKIETISAGVFDRALAMKREAA